jgi:hypothetical protein
MCVWHNLFQDLHYGVPSGYIYFSVLYSKLKWHNKANKEEFRVGAPEGFFSCLMALGQV